MDFHGRIMNIPINQSLLDGIDTSDSAQVGAYKFGHKDARHAAAEIAMEADREIEQLKKDGADLLKASQDQMASSIIDRVLLEEEVERLKKRIAKLEFDLTAVHEREAGASL